MSVEKHIEEEMNAIAAKHKDALNSALIQPFSPEWKFCTNGLYLLLATAGCGKSRFIIKHILMSERLFAEPYYSLICYCSTSGELDKAVMLTLTGPVGKIDLPCGILANRHVHISEQEANELNIKDKDPIKIIVHGEKSGIVDGYFKVSKEAYKELHIDIDDANSLLLKQDDLIEIEY